MPAQQKGTGHTSLPELVARVRGEYVEVPGLRVTLARAWRLWQTDMATRDQPLTACRRWPPLQDGAR